MGLLTFSRTENVKHLFEPRGGRQEIWIVWLGPPVLSCVGTVTSPFAWFFLSRRMAPIVFALSWFLYPQEITRCCFVFTLGPTQTLPQRAGAFVGEWECGRVGWGGGSGCHSPGCHSPGLRKSIGGTAFLSGILKQSLSFGTLMCCLGCLFKTRYDISIEQDTQIGVVPKWQEAVS